MSHQQNDDQTSQPPHDGSHSCELWMFERIVDARTQLVSIWTEMNAPPPATIERYIVLSASEALHNSECPICQEDYDDDQHVAIKLLETNCSHVFGRDCLQYWVNSGMQNAHFCPTCRQCIRGALSVPPSERGAEDEEEHVFEVFYEEEEEEEEELEAELEARLEAEFEEEHEEELDEELDEEQEEENEEENEEEHEDEDEDEEEEEEEEAEQVLSTQQCEQRDRHWANLTEVSNILQGIETIVVPPVAAGGR